MSHPCGSLAIYWLVSRYRSLIEGVASIEQTIKVDFARN
jgi:hypothetical protein